MESSEYIQLGKIIKVQGKDGEMVCHFSIEEPERYSDLEFVFIELDQRFIPFHIEAIDLSGNYARLQLEDINTPEEAHKLVSREIYLPEKDFPGLPEEEFYFHEIIGFTAIDKERGEIGMINDVLERPEQSLLQIHHKGKEILVPLVDDFLVDINKAQKQLILKIPEGLIDLYINPK